MTTKDQRVYPTRTADRCSDCPPAGYPTEKTRCYGCPLANTYKDATGELVIPTAAPSSNLVSRLRQRLITVPKPDTKPFDMPAAGYFQMGSVGGTHKPGDSAGVLSVFSTCVSVGNKLQEHIYAVDPLCEEAAQALERIPVETSDRPPMRTGLELIRDGQIPQGMSPALFADRVLRVAAQLTGDPYKAMCQGGSGGKCTDPDCEKCWPEEPAGNENLGPEAPGGVGVVDLAARSPDQLCKRCRHSYAQHTKGPVQADYCRHCACPKFVPYSSEKASGSGDST